ncbi:MAG: helix-turn-helix transcriptional regulator [Bacilli bacterium]|nr:helix-turn-helix transcriptional regulator [Bacilli bacterium]
MISEINRNLYTTVDIGERLRDIRKNNKYTKELLAKKLNTNISVIESWEDGLSLPSDRYLDKLSDIYGLPRNYLMGEIK